MIGALVTSWGSTRSLFLPPIGRGEGLAVRQGCGWQNGDVRIEVANKNKAFSGLSIA